MARPLSPLRRTDTRNVGFVQHVPVALRDRIDGLEVFVPIGDKRVRCRLARHRPAVRLSLRTSNPSEARKRHASVSAFFAQLWASLAAGTPVSLTHRQCVALAGEFFEAWISDDAASATAIVATGEMPEGSWAVTPAPVQSAVLWRKAAGHSADAVGSEAAFGRVIDHALRGHGIAAVDHPTRAMLLKAFPAALRDAFKAQARQADGDYTPPPEAQRFPAWERNVGALPIYAPKTGRRAAKVSLRGLVDRWWAEAKPAGRSRSTHESYKASVYRLAGYLRHDDALAVTKADVLRFKAHRIAAGVGVKTILDGDLAGLKSVFGFAVANGLIAENPAAGITLIRPRPTVTREKGFTAEEARAILAKALHHANLKDNAQTAAAKRWVPWLCAYTGARVGEVVQLRKEDVRCVSIYGMAEKVWTITITPEAGTVKTKTMRRVVLHPHLVEQGFPEFIAVRKAGPLFLKPEPKGGDLRGKAVALGHRLAAFAREVVPDKRVKPNHGWRHLFRTIGREAGIADSILDAVGGWAAKSVGERYGDVSLAAQGKAFERFPRFDVSKEPAL